MNSLQRIISTVKFEESDRIPVIAQIFGHAAVLSKVPLEDYLTNGVTAAECQIKALNYYGYDAVFSLFDVNVETESVSAKLKHYRDRYFTIEKYPINSTTNLNTLKLPNPYKNGRMPEVLKEAKILRKEFADQVAIIGCSLGPFTISTQLIGLENLLYLAVDEPENFNKLLNYATDIAITFGISQIQAGCHLVVIFEPAASPAVIPASFYREMLVPKLQKIFKSLKKSGAIANWIHTAGPIDSILKYYNVLNIDIANFDYCVDDELIKKELNNICINGNIKPLSFESDTEETITKESEKLLKSFSKRGGFILSSGCEIPPNSIPENIKAMVNSVRKNNGNN
jgi:uroporphyrinogen decarboxylase